MSRVLSSKKSILAVIVALAAFFRFYRLDSIPPGFQFDQAFYVFDVLRLLQGQFYIFFAAPGGTEPLYIYLAMPGVALAGITPLGLKLTTALIGVLTIPLIYGFARTFFRCLSSSDGEPRGEGIALLAALFAAISIWHVFFTRYGERITLLVLLTVLIYWFLWRALTPFSAKRERVGVAVWRNFVLIGLFLALALYTYPGSRVLPVALILLTAYAALTDRANAARYTKGLLFAFAATAIVFFPLGLYFVSNPSEFIGHTADVSIFVPHGEEQGNVAAALARNTIRLLGMFFVVGDSGVIRNVPNRPIFDPFTAALFMVGVIVCLVALLSPRSNPLSRKRAMFLAVWIVVALAVSFFSDDAPNFVRTLPAMPAVMILPAWGASEIWEHLRAPVVRRAAAIALGIIVLAGMASSYRDYFGVFANDPGLYYAFNADKVELADWINQNANTQTIYLAPVTYQVGTVSLLTRNAPLKSFESRDTIVLPSSVEGKDALFAFPPEQERKVQTMAARLGALGTREELLGSNGGKLLLLYRVPAKNLPDPQIPLNALTRGGAFIQPQKVERANWADQIELFGYTVNPEGPGGRNLTVELFLHALKPIGEDYTFSIKVRDQKDRVWGQEDKWLGDNSYQTTHWSVGDVVIEKFYPGLNACARAGDYRITVEAYNPKTLQVLALTDRAGNAVALGTTHVEASQSNRLEDLEPDHNVDVQVGERLRLIGYTLSADQVRLGDEFSLSLFWRGSGVERTERMTVRLKDAKQQDSVLIETQVRTPPEGRGLCSFFDFRMPVEFAPGPATIWVNDSELAGLNLTK